MKNNLKNLFKTTLLLVIVLQLTLISKVFAIDNIKIHDVTASKEQIIVEENDKLLLKQDWYGLRFEINSSNTCYTKYGIKRIKPVDIKEYERALRQVDFDLSLIGEYNVYFLDCILEDYSKTMALSFKDDSVVVFGTCKKMSKQEIHKIAVHELGHEIDFKLMNEEKWQEYKRIRGIENTEIYFNSSKIYSNRPQEIFAEDFRLIFGGELARRLPHLNSSLGDPNSNPELIKFFKNLANNYDLRV